MRLGSDGTCEGILEGRLRWHYGRLLIGGYLRWHRERRLRRHLGRFGGRLRWHHGRGLGRHLGRLTRGHFGWNLRRNLGELTAMASWTAPWRVLTMASWTVTAKATAKASWMPPWNAWSAEVTVEICHCCFWTSCRKSDLRPSPKNESSHSSETVISTSLT
jgi:hypothetical protein